MATPGVDHYSTQGAEMKYVVIICILITYVWAGQYDKVKITPTLSYMYVYHKVKAVKIHRIQDTAHKLTGEYAKQYRPNTEIQPIKMMQGIKTIGEIELLQFLQEKVNTKKGILIDVRTKKDYEAATIPSAVNIPYKTTQDREKMENIIHIFGLNRLESSEVDSSRAVDIAVFCHGLWCSKAPRFIQTLVALGYPKDKIFYYRGGMQMWKILGFTTVGN